MRLTRSTIGVAKFKRGCILLPLLTLLKPSLVFIVFSAPNRTIVLLSSCLFVSTITNHLKIAPWRRPNGLSFKASSPPFSPAHIIYQLASTCNVLLIFGLWNCNSFQSKSVSPSPPVFFGFLFKLIRSNFVIKPCTTIDARFQEMDKTAAIDSQSSRRVPFTTNLGASIQPGCQETMSDSSIQRGLVHDLRLWVRCAGLASRHWSPEPRPMHLDSTRQTWLLTWTWPRAQRCWVSSHWDKT